MIKVLSFSLLVAVVSSASLGLNIGVGGGVFSDSSRLSQAASGYSSDLVSGSDAFAAGSLNKESSSKSSASESGKSSKIKSGSSFAMGSQSVGASAYDSSKTGQLDYSAINKGVSVGFGIGGGLSQVGLASKDTAYQSGQKYGASSGYATGSSNTEIEKSEYNKNSASESHDVTQGSFANKGSNFGAESQNNYANRKDLAQDQYQAGGIGYSGLGGGLVSSDKSRLSESAAGSSSAITAGSENYAAGNIDRVSSSKSSASESGKSSKIKSGSNYATGSQSVGASAYDASKASQLDYGASSVGLQVGLGGGISKVGLVSVGVSATKGQAYDASAGYAVGSSNTEVEESEYNKNAQSESHDVVKGSYAAGSSDFIKAQQNGYASNKDASRDQSIRIRRSSQNFNDGSRLFSGSENIYAGQGFNVGGSQLITSNSRLSQLSQGAFSGLQLASTGFSTGKVSKVSSSKSSSSESKKSTKIKTGTNFQAANQNVAASVYDASKLNQLNYGATAVGVSGAGAVINVGLSTNENSTVNQKALGASTNFISSTSNTEIEQEESQKHSESETNEAVEGTFTNSDSDFGVAQQANYAQNQQYNSQSGIFGSESGKNGNSEIIAENQNKLSSLAASSGIVTASSDDTVGTTKKKSSTKKSSSESNKGTKIKTGTNFQAGCQNIVGNTYDASKSNQLNYGANAEGVSRDGAGLTNVALSTNENSIVNQQALEASTNIIKGSSNTEIEQTESQKNSESETNEASDSTFKNSGSSFDVAQQANNAQNQQYSSQTGILGSGTEKDGNSGVVAENINKMSSSSLGTSSGISVASSGKIISTIDRKALAKNSSTESGKGTRINTGSNFNFGGLNLQIQHFGLSKLPNFNLVSNTRNFRNLFSNANLNIDLSANNNINKHQKSPNYSSEFSQGSSNTEIEQTEANKNSESETNDATQTSYAGNNFQFGVNNESAMAQNDNSENSSIGKA